MEQHILSDLMAAARKGTAVDRGKWIEVAIQKANKAVFDLGKKMSSDMGSTIVMAVVEGNEVCLGHVGDSRAYRLNRKEIIPLTTDHSLVERLVETGQITREQARNHPQRNVVYRTMGDKDKVEVETSSFTMSQGDRLLLCSDGLNGMVEDRAIHKIVMESGLSPQAACERLIHAANAAGGDDNITVVLLEFV
jgi:protein phosphatase